MYQPFNFTVLFVNEFFYVFYDTRNAYKMLVGNSGGKRQHWRNLQCFNENTEI